MKFCIHRGSDEIGGTCIELESQGRRIVLDVGLTLVNGERRNGDDEADRLNEAEPFEVGEDFGVLCHRLTTQIDRDLADVCRYSGRYELAAGDINWAVQLAGANVDRLKSWERLDESFEIAMILPANHRVGVGPYKLTNHEHRLSSLPPLGLDYRAGEGVEELVAE